ncbi:MAG: hypothetical protein UT34_C0001G0163 [candidate division WS6 bacterium GW2011_GWF2_39_15]|uniref:Lipoprotein n=1 Tax=candidate division WS6 bacterium GW2011_GWF2_39_15 TaxID=1619100 RepID=A0A0G0MSK7_9BACT|nr:MAG: hypothetical protein UT34_C0001G0163 [candidate division WS6 bacterium GW2011_GWF2_39_15]
MSSKLNTAASLLLATVLTACAANRAVSPTPSYSRPDTEPTTFPYTPTFDEPSEQPATATSEATLEAQVCRNGAFRPVSSDSRMELLGTDMVGSYQLYPKFTDITIPAGTVFQGAFNTGGNTSFGIVLENESGLEVMIDITEVLSQLEYDTGLYLNYEAEELAWLYFAQCGFDPARLHREMVKRFVTDRSVGQFPVVRGKIKAGNLGVVIKFGPLP